MSDLTAFFTHLKQDRERDADRYERHDQDLCMLCGAHGADKRSLFISCLYDIKEVIPEAIDLFACPEPVDKRGYYLRICKTCRGQFLRMLKDWRAGCIALRPLSKDHDGRIERFDSPANIPVRLHGALRIMTPEEYEQYKAGG